MKNLNFLNRLLPVFVLTVVIAMTACSFTDGEEILFSVPRPDKHPPENEAATIRVALYVDASDAGAKDILKNAGNYYIEINGNPVPYFDYIIISGGEIKRGAYTASLVLTDSLQELLLNRRSLIKPLRDKGLKVLLGITGGNDGISFGSLADQTNQKMFAIQCVNACTYYELDGIELWDINADSPDHSPYPQIGELFWTGEEYVMVHDQGSLDYEMKRGGGNMADMMSYVIVSFGASTSFQGDLPLDQKEETPILIRETGFGQYIPPDIPRFPFATTLACLSYAVNDNTARFGMDDKGNPYNSFTAGRFQAPLMIDLSDINQAELELFSQKFGTRDWGTDDAVPGDSIYGMFYYANMQPYSEAQREILSVTSREVFGKEVIFR